MDSRLTPHAKAKASRGREDDAGERRGDEERQADRQTEKQIGR